MANATPNRPGQVNGSGATDALFEKIHTSEILAAFEKRTKFRDKQQLKVISHGKSASFPATWRVTSGYHTPGTEILGESVNHNEVVITIDGKLLTSVFVDALDDAMNHFDQDSVYTTEMGRELATQYDANVQRTIILAARAGAIVTGRPGGNNVQSATIADTSANLKGGIFDAMQALAEDDVPTDDVIYAAFRPAEYFLMTQDTNLQNKDWGGTGSLADGTVLRVAGAQILMSNNTSFGSDLSADASVHAKYQADYSVTRGIVWHPKSIGTVQLRGLMTRKVDDGRRDGYLFTAKYAVGHGHLMPEAAVELRTGAPT